ncbi:DinB family protein [Streptococcus pluranimalium]|uniref:DinB family protein n=1 Tax=Streptococcus pluranimalium TaxID=82348 RepID=UPI003BF7E2C6
MTTFKDLLIDNLSRAYERFERAFDGVMVEQANRFPVADTAPQLKSMTWLLWHTALVLDVQIAELAGTDWLYHQGWQERLPENRTKNPSWLHTLEEAQTIKVDSFEHLFAYFSAAKEQAVTYISSLTEESLDDIVDESWTPAVTRGVRLVSTIDDVTMHSGQVLYARRLLGLTD